MSLAELSKRLNTTGRVKVDVGSIDFLMPVIVVDVKMSYGKVRWGVRPFPDSNEANPAGLTAWVENVHFNKDPA